MNRLKTVYAGLKLKNPIVISSSGLTNSPERILNLEKAGAGAVVLKSLFEEQIDLLMNQYSGYNEYPEAMDYVRAYSENHSISEYTQLIRDSKSLCTIPVIASIHCYSDGSWTSYAEYIEKAGADAIELNISVMNTGRNPIDVEELHVQIVRSVKSKIKIPVIVKLGANFTNLIPLIERLKGAGATAVVLFNRFYQPDININKQTFSAGNVFSNAQDIHHTLRWTSIVTGVLPEVEVSASTGIHDWESAIKVLLSGATTVQLCSAVYEQGDVVISQISTCIEEWMVQKGYHHIEEFRGKLNYKNIANPSMYERMQFMKFFAEKE